MKKWRNPYTPLKQKERLSRAAATTLAPQRANSIYPSELRTSVSRIRTNIKGISSTIRQVEETMDTLFGAMEILDSLSRSTINKQAEEGKKNGRSRIRADRVDDDPGAATGQGLGNLDIGQLFHLLQSPLVQNLLNSKQSEFADTGKKEG